MFLAVLGTPIFLEELFSYLGIIVPQGVRSLRFHVQGLFVCMAKLSDKVLFHQ